MPTWPSTLPRNAPRAERSLSRSPFAGARRARARGCHSCRGHRSERSNRLGRYGSARADVLIPGAPRRHCVPCPVFSAFFGGSARLRGGLRMDCLALVTLLIARADSISTCVRVRPGCRIDGGFRRTIPLRGFLFERGMRLSDARFAIAEHHARLFHERGMPCAVTRLLCRRNLPRRGKVHRLPLGRALPSCEATAPLSRSHGTLAKCSLPDDLLNTRRAASAIGQHPRTGTARRGVSRGCALQGNSTPFQRSEHFCKHLRTRRRADTFIHSGLGHAAIFSLAVDPDGMFGKFQAGFFAAGTSNGSCTKPQDCLKSAAAGCCGR